MTVTNEQTAAAGKLAKAMREVNLALGAVADAGLTVEVEVLEHATFGTPHQTIIGHTVYLKTVL